MGIVYKKDKKSRITYAHKSKAIWDRKTDPPHAHPDWQGGSKDWADYEFCRFPLGGS